MNEAKLRELQARDKIRESLSRYCRGLDRMDKPMAYSVFTEQCSAIYHGLYEGSGHGFVDWVWEAHAAMQSHSHQITNVLIEVDGDRATSEAYVTVALWTKPPQTDEIVVRGRYLDRWLCIGGQWLINEREHIIDLQSTNGTPDVAAPNTVSTRDQRDGSYQFSSFKS